MRRLTTVHEVRDAVGETLGRSRWFLVTQDHIDRFADVTEDRQWIHVDTAAAAAGAFGSTIAHGYFTLALIPHFASQIVEYGPAWTRVNYGLGSVRFPGPVPVARRIRDEMRLISAEPHYQGLKVAMRHTIEIEGMVKPACVAETLTLLQVR